MSRPKLTEEQKRNAPLKPKEVIFVEKLPKNNFNATKTFKEAFGNENDASARSMASELLAKPNIKAAVEEKVMTLKDALIKQGITPQKIAAKVEVLLNASDKEGATDFTAVDKGLKHAKDIYGVVDAAPPQQKNVYNFFFDPKLRADVKELEERIKAKLINQDDQTPQEDVAAEQEGPVEGGPTA